MPQQIRNGVVAQVHYRLIALGAAIAVTIGAGAVRGIAGQERTVRFGDPLPGLLPAEFERFRLGLDDFLEVETAEEGLGPSFNAASCAVCHNLPAIGGGSLVSEVRAAHRDPQGVIRPLMSADGTLLDDTLFHLFSNPAHGCQPALPAEANIIARRIPIPTFGAGLVETIADETLVALEDPDDRNGDGISGRAAVIIERATGQRRVGRFGWKAQHATLRTFSADAYRNEMGITNELFRDELAPGITVEQLRRCDPIPDPEDVPDPRTRLAAIDNFEAFMKFLAPPPRGAIDDAVRSGEAVFRAIGCGACHVPALETEPSRHPLFDRKPVPLFSDLLLHDIGTGDGIPQASALPTEIRTPSLWGLSVRRPFLHDGSASTLEEAIDRHRGEAEMVRRRFDQLDGRQRANLIAFLNSL
jgi:CxxC motif-containing protein (DUF1111 family)